ncbi:MAG: DNA-processing protein DprA [Myxococcota bacterium]|nr:DNA-processing protein DprA [Myxococcota bacterium]
MTEAENQNGDQRGGNEDHEKNNKKEEQEGSLFSGPSNGFDARSQDPRSLFALKQWLILQASLCLSPVHAIECIEAASGDPGKALRLSRQKARWSEKELQRWMNALAQNRIRALPVTSSSYPMSLRVISDPPALLLFRGQLPDWNKPSVAIVGARAATRYGLTVASQLAEDLAKSGITVVSGLARGIDAAAHRGALRFGTTWAVLGCGPDRIYPGEHKELANEISRSGTILSELPLGRPPAAPHFPLRNRIISGLVKAVVVVEARLRSGSLITARHALQQGREVMVVPGSIQSPTSDGTNALLRDGARPVLDAGDILEFLGERGLPSVEEPRLTESGDSTYPKETPSRDILDTLRRENMDRDSLQRALGLSSRELSLRLVELEISGWVTTDRDGRLCLTRARGLARF